MTEAQYCELKMQIKALEERMNTKQAEYKTDIAKLQTDLERRDKDTMWRQIALFAVATAAIGLMIALTD